LVQNVSKEIFVTVDQPTEVFLETLKELEKEMNTKFIVIRIVGKQMPVTALQTVHR
jgi:hypothetical protein